MSAIFLSHSSADNLIAGEIAAYLESIGHRSFFLDFDSRHGITAGRNWEQELYRQLRACQAVIVLWSSRASDSKWVFAEVTHARALGKPLFPLVLEPCEMPAILNPAQAIDFTGEREESYRRLARGLKEEARLNVQSAFDWDGSRPPYRGLLALDVKDAAIFFGRDTEVRAGLDQLRSLQRLGGARVVLVLGASGSGKSSLVRAGLLPNLGLDRESWLVVPPFRPQPGPFPKTDPFKELAIALADSFKGFGLTRDWAELRKALAQAAEETPPRGAVLEEIVEDLRIASGHREATALLSIDQFEELLINSDPAQAGGFLALLRAALADPNIPLILLCTLRSDFFQHFQQHPQAQDLAFEILSVPPMSSDQWTKIIEGPAAKAGIRLEPGLVTALVRDTETEDALPLLAFTLRELWEQFGRDDGVLELKEYREGLGGLVGSIAKVAETVFAAQSLSAEQEAELRRAFSTLLVSVDANGTYVQQTARWADLPAGVHGVLEEFVKKRLLISRLREGEREVEVAHAALFRSWERLEEWLRNERDFLLWRSGLRLRLAEWEEAGDADLLPRGVRLAEGERWCEERPEELLPRERTFIQAGRAAQEEQQQRWEELYRKAVARQLAAQSEIVRTQRAGLLQRSALLAVESLRQSPSAEGAQALRRGAALLPTPGAEMIHNGIVTSVAFSPRAGWLAAGGGGDSIRLWEFSADAPARTLMHEDYVEAVVFTPDGERLASASKDGTARVWDVESGEELVRMQHEGQLASLTMSPDGRWLATTVRANKGDSPLHRYVWLWRCLSGKRVSKLEHDGAVSATLFSPDGRYLACADWGRTVHVWGVPCGRKTPEVLRLAHPDTVMSLAFSPDSRSLATGCYTDGAVRVWDVATGQEDEDRRVLHENGVGVIAFSPDGAYMATASRDHTARLWEASTAREVARMPHESNVHTLAFHPSGRYLATAGAVTAARLWEVPGGREVARAVHEGTLNTFAFSPDGRYLATGSGHVIPTTGESILVDTGVRLWDLEGGWLDSRVSHQGNITAMAFDPRGRYLATASLDGTARLWSPSTWREVACMTHDGKKVSSLAFDPQGEYLATAGGYKVILWEVGSGRVLRTLPTDWHEAGALAVSQDGCWIAATAGKGKNTVKVWEAATGLEAACFDHPDTVRRMRLSPDGRCLAIAGEDALRVFEVESGREILRLDVDSSREILRLDLFNYTPDVTWTPDGRYIIATPTALTGVMFDASSGSRVAELPHQYLVKSCAVSTDGKYVAAMGYKSVSLWEVVGVRAVLELKVDATIYGINFTPDGAHLGLACEDHTTRVYTVPGGQEVARVTHESSVTNVEFSPDGRYLAAQCGDGVDISIWRTEDLMEEACARLTRNLTADEWQEHLGDEPYDKTCRHLTVHDSLSDHALNMVAAGDLEGAIRLLERILTLEPAYTPEIEEALNHLRNKLTGNAQEPEPSPD